MDETHTSTDERGRIGAGTILVLAAATAGLAFSAVSTFDFVQHLDRQVHDIHCSFVPGLAATDHAGESGCQVTMMSPHSSVIRDRIWGGLPISLPSMAVFAFLLYRGVSLLGRPRGARTDAALALCLLSLVPVAASLRMGWIAYSELGAACKSCIGIYASSGLSFLGGLFAWLGARRETRLGPPRHPMLELGFALVQLGGFVAVPVLVYLGTVPDHAHYTGTCGTLDKPDDPYGVLIPLERNSKATPAIELLDPLCPACRGFEKRLAASGLSQRLDRQALMFPLDSTCNWMLDQPLHPGACAISEAVVCAVDDKQLDHLVVLEWAFANQEQIREAATADPEAAARMAVAQFPALEPCIGKPEVRSKINKSLRWAVANGVPVLTPQLYVDGVKLCDEDTDLGMDFALTRLLDARSTGGASR